VTQQRGVVLIIVLWFLMVVTVMIATLATETRLSAVAVLHNKAGLKDWSHTMAALQLAQMEILMANMAAHPDDEEKQEFLKENWPWQNRFDGRPLNLAYNDVEYDEIPDEYRLPKGTVVRIYDHAGKINLANLQPNEFRELLKYRIGEDDIERLDSLIDAWRDWIDSDDLERMNGAEDDYYEELDPPYKPRNNNLETVQELLLIKGFTDVYTIKEVETAFTLHGTHQKLNPNLATREALNMLPGSGGLTEQILVSRRFDPIRNPGMLNDFAQPEQLAEFLPWIGFDTGLFYTVVVQHDQTLPIINEDGDIELRLAGMTEDDVEEAEENIKSEQDEPPANKQGAEQAYSIIVQTRGMNRLPKILQVNPYGFVPDHSYELAIMQRLKENEESMLD
jgi:general secretion pathway protein K